MKSKNMEFGLFKHNHGAADMNDNEELPDSDREHSSLAEQKTQTLPNFAERTVHLQNATDSQPGDVRTNLSPLENRYLIQKLLGQGGMGQVFLGLDNVLQRPVAIKLSRELTENQRRRFLSEARAQAKIVHPNILHIYEVGEFGGQPFLVMHYVDGPTLQKIQDSLNPDEKLDIAIQICQGVHAAHLRGIIHRDLKPSNILLERDSKGTWKPLVMDFGLAKDLERPSTTVSGTLLGSPCYMSPEQVRGESLDCRTDVYSLGVILFELYTGRLPFQGESTIEVLKQVVDNEVPQPRTLNTEIREEIEIIILKCLHKDREQRYSDALSLCEDLERVREGTQILARRPNPVLNGLKKYRKLITGILVVVCLILVPILVMKQYYRSGSSALTAQEKSIILKRISELEQEASRLEEESLRQRETANRITELLSGRLSSVQRPELTGQLDAAQLRIQKLNAKMTEIRSEIRQLRARLGQAEVVSTSQPEAPLGTGPRVVPSPPVLKAPKPPAVGIEEAKPPELLEAAPENLLLTRRAWTKAPDSLQIQGETKVVVDVQVDASGKPTGAKIAESGTADFDLIARERALGSRYRPGESAQGRSEAGEIRLTFNFLYAAQAEFANMAPLDPDTDLSEAKQRGLTSVPAVLELDAQGNLLSVELQRLIEPKLDQAVIKAIKASRFKKPILKSSATSRRMELNYPLF